MLCFFDYLFYRLATSNYYKKVAHQYAYVYAYGFTSLCEGFNVLTIIKLFSHFTGLEITTRFILLVCCIPLLVFNSFRLDERRYVLLCEMYKEKSDRRLNGIKVIVYVSLTWILFFYTMFFVG